MTNLIKNFHLTPLSKEDREATLGASNFYLLWFKDNAKDYHQTGDQWSDSKLQMFFETGLFNHYIQTHLLTMNVYDIDIGYNYEAWLTKKYEGCRFAKHDKERFVKVANLFGVDVANLTDEQLITTVKPYALQLQKKIRASCALDKFPLKLLQLGATFQRQKVETEKLNSLISPSNSESQNADIQMQTLLKDQEAELNQFIIYHWTRDCINQLFTHIQDHVSDLDQVDFQFKNPDFLPDAFK